MNRVLIISILAFFLISFKSDKPAYYLYDNTGKKVKFSKMIDEIKDADIILFGELHNNPISHWLQLELTKELFDHKKDNLILAAEMFESDNQIIIDEYLNNIISRRKFEAECRLWPNYRTDYKPLMSFAKDSNLHFIASNVPRRYASAVYSSGFEGLDKLSDEAKSFLPPLPILYDADLNCYKSMISAKDTMVMHQNNNLPKAQALKDATMSHFILKGFEEGKLILHYNGAYHSDNYESIVWYLRKANPNLNIKTISTHEEVDIESVSEEVLSKADYVIVVPQSMTKTN